MVCRHLSLSIFYFFFSKFLWFTISWAVEKKTDFIVSVLLHSPAETEALCLEATLISVEFLLPGISWGQEVWVWLNELFMSEARCPGSGMHHFQSQLQQGSGSEQDHDIECCKCLWGHSLSYWELLSEMSCFIVLLVVVVERKGDSLRPVWRASVEWSWPPLVNKCYFFTVNKYSPPPSPLF